tara:strand:- start:1326 stop:1436 length:111 start_codon:yes stop_codon:yes gene_type:complete
MDWLKEHLDKIWGAGIGFVVGFLFATLCAAQGWLTY